MTDERLPYFKFYPQDFMGSGKVQMMGPVERGIYISLLCQEWQEGPLPDNPTVLARVASATPEQMEEAWPLVRSCFQVDDEGLLYHERLEEEREAALDRRRKAQKAAAASARVRRADAQASAQADAGADANASADTDEGASGGARDEPYSESHSSEKETTAASTTAREASPEEFEELFPDHPEARTALAGLKHLGGETTTVASLRTKFLYPDGKEGVNPPDCVFGKPLERRRELVASALLEMRETGVRKFKSATLSGYIAGLGRRDDRNGNGISTGSRGKVRKKKGRGSSGPDIRGERRRSG